MARHLAESNPSKRSGNPLGYPLLWRYEHSGGYGYVTYVPCRFIRYGATRVLVAALRKDGTEKERWISPTSLVPPPGGD